MQNNKILLMGHKGYLGSFLNSKLVVDITDNNKHYDYVINCIGKPNLEFCEQEPQISYISNYRVVEDLVRKYPNSKIIHFSSYYVYDELGECNESSNTTDRYIYCEHKILSERIVIDSGGIVFRLGKLFGHLEVNKQKKLTESIITGSEIILDDTKFNPTSVHQVLRVIKHELKIKNLTGLFNLSNKGNTTHYKYGLYLKKNFNLDIKIHRVAKMSRSFHNYGKFLMSCDKINSYIPLTSWQRDVVLYGKELGVQCLGIY